MTKQEEIALRKYRNKEHFSVSTSIDEDSILAGYGELTNYGFELPLPDDVIIKEYGTTSWTEHFKMRGINRYEIKETNGEFIAISHLMSEEEAHEIRLLNPGLILKKL